MPVVTTQPVEVEPAKEATEYRIVAFSYYDQHSEEVGSIGSQFMVVQCVAGELDVASGSFIVHKRWSVTVPEADLLVETAKVTLGNTIYLEVKNALYAYLQAQGEFPAGVVT